MVRLWFKSVCRNGGGTVIAVDRQKLEMSENRERDDSEPSSQSVNVWMLESECNKPRIVN